MEFRHKRLNNGLDIIAETNDDAYSMSVAFIVRTGSRDEMDDVAGVSHFLEHMCFKGTPRRSADDVNREFDEIGAHYNAFTSEECTAYYAAVLPEYQEASVDILADILRPSLRPEDFDMEKKVILEEIQMYLDQPPFGMDDRIKQLHMGHHPLAKSVLGTSKSVGDLTPKQMRDYFELRYGADNVFVAAAGKVDFDALVEQVSQRCAGWKSHGARREIPRATSKAHFEVVHRPTATQQYVLQLADAPASEDADRYAAKLLATIVGDDSGSRMYWELTDPGLAESATLGHYEYLGAGMFYTWLACEPEMVEENLKRLSGIYRQVELDGVTDEELRQAKNKVKARVVLGSERPQNRLFNVGGNWLQRHGYRTVADDLAALDEVSAEAVMGVLQRFPFSRCTTITVGPRQDVRAPE
ncbi:MAG TPA: pitrilysin family protein [Lacipirellulaceae bacterium]|nr:pitrilysin family protein [Lacipirellulaceae bacterium]